MARGEADYPINNDKSYKRYLSCDRDFIYLSNDGYIDKNLAFCPGNIREVSADELFNNGWNWNLSGEDYQALVWEFFGLAVIVFAVLIIKKAL